MTNHYDVGSLHLVKEVDGDALDNNPVIGRGPVHAARGVHAHGRLARRHTVYDDDVVLEGEQPLEATIDDLPTGAVCDVTEPDDGGATDHTIDAEPGHRSGTAPPSTVTATNTFDAGDMTVTKTVDSDGGRPGRQPDHLRTLPGRT